MLTNYLVVSVAGRHFGQFTSGQWRGGYTAGRVTNTHTIRRLQGEKIDFFKVSLLIWLKRFVIYLNDVSSIHAACEAQMNICTNQAFKDIQIIISKYFATQYIS